MYAAAGKVDYAPTVEHILLIIWMHSLLPAFMQDSVHLPACVMAADLSSLRRQDRLEG